MTFIESIHEKDEWIFDKKIRVMSFFNLYS